MREQTLKVPSSVYTNSLMQYPNRDIFPQKSFDNRLGWICRWEAQVKTRCRWCCSSLLYFHSKLPGAWFGLVELWLSLNKDKWLSRTAPPGSRRLQMQISCRLSKPLYWGNGCLIQVCKKRLNIPQAPLAVFFCQRIV